MHGTDVRPVAAVARAHERHEADSGADEEGKGDDGDEQGAQDLRKEKDHPVRQTAALVLAATVVLGGAIQEHEPARQAVLGLGQAANGLDARVPEVLVHQRELRQPGDDTLQDDGHRGIAHQRVGELKQVDGLFCCAVHS